VGSTLMQSFQLNEEQHIVDQVEKDQLRKMVRKLEQKNDELILQNEVLMQS
jgi:hypothetical protein